METLAIVILNYNGAHFLERFLPSVLAHSDGFPVYVADNASTDHSVDVVTRRFPAVRLLRLPTNAGYAGGYNQALAQIEATYYVLLNSDVEVTPGWIEPVLALLNTHPNVVACQPKIRQIDQRTTFEYAGAAGGYLDRFGYAFCRGRLFDTVEVDTGQYDDNRPVFWATGACLFVRATTFRQTGGFDARFFAHMEEIDWCWRVQRSGHEVWTCGRSVVHHVGGGTLTRSNPRKTFLNYRNSLLMLYKNLPAHRLWRTLLLRLVLDGVSGVKLLASGHWRDVVAIIRAHGSFYSLLPQYRAARRPYSTSNVVEQMTYPRSIVWDYFIKARQTFSALNWDPLRSDGPIIPTRLDERADASAYSSPARKP